jgi:hypothetical protein
MVKQAKHKTSTELAAPRETALQLSLKRMELLNAHLAKGDDPFAVAKIESAMTVRQSIETGIQIRLMGKKYGYEETLKLVSRLIENTAAFFNLNGNLTGTQLVQISQAIIERYVTDNIEDIILALKNARMGLCEKIYGRIDGEIVMGWIAQYMETKAEEMEKIHHQKKTEAITIAPSVAKAIRVDLEKRAETEQEYQQSQLAGVMHIENGSSVDHETWCKWFEANKESLQPRELKSIRVQLQANNLYGSYTEIIDWIHERTK